MNSLPKVVWISFLGSALVLSLSAKAGAQTAEIRHIGAVKSGGSTQIEIETSKRVMPLTQVVTDPDRLVIDFSGAVPGPQLRALKVNNGAVKGVRFGKVTANPPVTRVVIDLTAAHPFQIFPSSKSVMVKFGEDPTAIAAVPAPVPVPSEPPVTVPKARSAKASTPSISPVSAPGSSGASLRVTTLSAPAVAVSPSISVTRWPVVASATPGQINRVAVLKANGATEIEIETSQHFEPDVQAITGPDRLVLDFPGALPGPKLRALTVNQGEVKGVRVGLLSSKPPVTRVVLDLNSAQVYQIFPSAKSLIVKLPGAGTAMASAALGISAAPTAPQTPTPPPKNVEVSLQDGKLRIVAARASLAEVLNELRQQTGAEIVVPAGTEQEVVAVTLGPGSPREVLTKLLDGSHYNFIIVGTDQDANQVERLILSPKAMGGVNAMNQNAVEAVPVAQMQTPQRSSGPAPETPIPPTEDVQPEGDSNPPPDTTPQPGDPQAAPN